MYDEYMWWVNVKCAKDILGGEQKTGRSSFTWCHIFYLEFSDVSVLGNTSGSIDTDVGKLPRIGVLHGPQFLTLDDQRKDVLGPMLDLAYLHSCPFIDGRLLCPEQLSFVSLPIESGANVDSTGAMDPQSRSLVSNNVLVVDTCSHVQDLCKVVVVVACWLQFKGNSPLFG